MVASLSPGRKRDPSAVSRAELFAVAEAVVSEIRQRVLETTQLTCSAGVAPNFMLAKVASDQKKPDGQFIIPPDRAAVLRFVRELPARKVSGIGKVAEKLLKALGVVTCGDMFDRRAVIHRVFTPRMSGWLLHVSLGIGAAEHDDSLSGVPPGAVTRKGISKERTFAELSRPEDLYDKCREICKGLAAEMAEEGLAGRCVTLKLKETSFAVRSRAHTTNAYLSTEEELFRAASGLLKDALPLRLRLMGVRVSQFRNQ
ncbi:unnamed protein product, partial [Phaeothamnion confervicola]